MQCAKCPFDQLEVISWYYRSYIGHTEWKEGPASDLSL